MSLCARELAANAARTLQDAGVPDAVFDAAQLLLHASGWAPSEWLLRKEGAVPPETAARYGELVARRAAGEPLQYILGKWPFYEREFFVGRGVLIPRPETEELTALCVKALRARPNAVVYDLCAGSGCIGISIACACPETDVYLFELSEDALFYLKKNIPAAAAGRVFVLRHDIFADCPADVPAPDLIVSNPPYIPSGQLSGLQKEVQKEPQTALDGGADGLDFYRRITSYWLKRLKKNGFAAMECGEGQAGAIAAMLRDHAPRILNDSFGTARFVLCDL